MAEPFKNLLGPSVVVQAAHHLGRVWPTFDTKRFSALALDGLESLELKARAMQICAALEATLPSDFAAAADLLEAALARTPGHVNLGEAHAATNGWAGWVPWPCGEFVARRGLAHPERALRVLHAMTQRFTAEFAIRPFIVTHPALTFATLQRWATDPSPHVRRLVSEGSRPRLPWGMRLRALIDDPSPSLPLLRTLQDDPSEYVRRSGTKHLNDIAKDHPALVTDWVETHLPGAPPERARLLRHACRTLIKAGDRRALHGFGFGAPLRGSATLARNPKRLVLGDALQLEATLVSTTRRPQKLAVDYVVHHAKANGSTTPKVFKGWVLDLGAGERRTLAKRHAVRPITTRVYHSGPHQVELLVNGLPLAQARFHLVTPAKSTPGLEAR